MTRTPKKPDRRKLNRSPSGFPGLHPGRRLDDERRAALAAQNRRAVDPSTFTCAYCQQVLPRWEVGLCPSRSAGAPHSERSCCGNGCKNRDCPNL